MTKNNTRRGFTQQSGNRSGVNLTLCKTVQQTYQMVSGSSPSIRGCTPRPSSSRNVSMRDIGAAHTLYPALQTCGVTERVARGFTLIELLVVVLIISILAAVALPQYQRAVKRTHGKEVYVAVDALDKALSVYALGHGDLVSQIDPNSIFLLAEELDIKIPSLKHFVYQSQLCGASVGGGGSRDFKCISNNQLYMFYGSGGGNDASVFVSWDGVTGQRLRFTCEGNQCEDHFSCNWHQEPGCHCGNISPCPS